MNEDEPIATVDPLLERAWGLIANADSWERSTVARSLDALRHDEWVNAARRWRDEYHGRLDAARRLNAEQPTEPTLAERIDVRQHQRRCEIALECASRLGGRMGGTAVVTVIQDAEAFLRWLERP